MTISNSLNGRVIRPGEGRNVRAFGSEIDFMLSGDHTGGSLVIGIATVPVGNGPPMHVHQDEDEVFLIIEGEYRICLEGEWTTVGPGAVVYLPRGCAHTFQVVGSKPGKHWGLTTGGGFEQFFTRSAEMVSASGRPDFARLGALAAEYRYSFLPQGSR